MRTYLKNSLLDKIRFTISKGCTARDLMQQRYFIKSEICYQLHLLRLSGSFAVDFLEGLSTDLHKQIEGLYLEACSLINR